MTAESHWLMGRRSEAQEKCRKALALLRTWYYQGDPVSVPRRVFRSYVVGRATAP